MHNRSHTSWLLSAVALPILFTAPTTAAQIRPAVPAKSAAAQSAPAQAVPPQPVPTDRDVASTQAQLIKLLRLSPTLTQVVARDPSLLSNIEYVNHTNPQLGEFLATHPEVARNPDFYLFTHLNREGGGPDEALERAVWPDVYRARPERTAFQEFASDLPPVLAFSAFLVAFIWVMRIVLDNRRWGRIFKLQSEIHGRLIEKFSSTQELAGYMETEAGKRFLEAAPIPVNFGPEQRVPNAVARVLTPLQIGVVLVLLGIGFLLLRHAGPDLETPMRVLGVMILMPGVGFIISAGLTWVLAARLGLMPPTGNNPLYGSPQSRNDAPFSSSERN
jgi:hypothetical protein